MPLTVEEQQYTLKILHVLYGYDVLHGQQPTEETLRLTEKVLVEIAECNEAISSLLQSLPYAIVGGGFLRKSLKEIAKLIMREQREFGMCTSAAARNFKSDIALSVY